MAGKRNDIEIGDLVRKTNSTDWIWQVAEFVRANYQELGVNYVMYAQRIWSVDRASEGWRYVEDRGSVTANHYDHVHVTTY